MAFKKIAYLRARLYDSLRHRKDIDVILSQAPDPSVSLKNRIHWLFDLIDWIRREPLVAAWAEQYLLQCLLSSNRRYQVLWPGYYLQRTISSDQFNQWFPNSNGQDAHSFWFSIVR